MIDETLYNKGSKFFKRIVDEFRDLSFEKYTDYNFVNVFYKTPIYKLHILSIPLYMNEMNYKENLYKYRLEHKSFYEDKLEKNKVYSVKETENLIRGYRNSRFKIRKRLYLLKNNYEFLKQALQNSKNML